MSLTNSKDVVDSVAFASGAAGTALTSAATDNLGVSPFSDIATPIVVGFLTGIVFPFLKDLFSSWLKRRNERKDKNI